MMRKADFGGFACEHCGDHRTVAVGDLARGQRAPSLDEFVAGGENRDARAAADRKLVGAAHRRGSNGARGQAGSRGEQAFAGGEIARAGADMAAARAGAVAGQGQRGAVYSDILLHDDGVGAAWDDRAGEDAHRFAWVHGATRRSTGGAFADDGPRAGEFVEANRIAVHGRYWRGGLVALGKDIIRGVAANAFGK